MALEPSVAARTSEPVGIIGASPSQSAVSWGAIFAGAVVASAVTVSLTVLGSAVGLSSVPTVANDGATAGSIAIGAVVWLIVTQWVSSSFGGYLAGRLRTRATGVHTDEHYFRDTAHGFVAWAVATIITVGVVASVGSSVLGAGARALGGAAQTAVQGAATASGGAAGNPALVDTLFRSAQPSANGSSEDAKAEAGRILATSLANGSIAPADKTYLAQLAASRTGLSQQDAEKRVDDMVSAAKAAADKAKAAAEDARKASAKLAYYTFFAMLIGAFIASVSGALGGRLRDH